MFSYIKRVASNGDDRARRTRTGRCARRFAKRGLIMKMPSLNRPHLHLPHLPNPRREDVWTAMLVTLLVAVLLAVAVGVAMNPEYLNPAADSYPIMFP